MQTFNRFMIAASLLLSCASNAIETNITIEEHRLEKALTMMPVVTQGLNARVTLFQQQLAQARSYTVFTQLVLRHAPALWQDAKTLYGQANRFDDRPLYWGRLQMSRALKQAKGFRQLLPNQQEKLLWTFELLSRGQRDVNFDKNTDKKILLTGFDPFFLDRNIAQSNPSGVVALSLDNIVLSVGGKTAEVEVLIVPVRFADFDQGMIEELLSPYLENQSVDMILTVSMGRENFDLERFPARNRSVTVADNLNVFTGANATKPLAPMLKNQPLLGPEFVEFSLPAASMKNAKGTYQVNDNRQVTTLSNGTFAASSLNQINKQTSVRGSGGGYLSNEISYRSILLRNRYQPLLPVGHLHTPKIKTFDQQVLANIVTQTKSIITQAVSAL